MLESLEPRNLLAITVNTPDDITEANDGLTSLREAVDQAAAQPGPDTIDFDPSLYAAGPATIRLVSRPGTRTEPAVGPLVIDSDVTFLGPGADRLTIQGEGSQGEVQVTVVSGVTVNFVDLALSTYWRKLCGLRGRD